MMTEKELQEYKTPCQYINGKLIPCVVVISHLEANAEIEVYKKESVLKNGLINQYKAEIEKLNKELLQAIAFCNKAISQRDEEERENEKLKAEVERLENIVEKGRKFYYIGRSLKATASERTMACQEYEQALADGKKEE